MRELTSPALLCTAEGRLDPRAIGWSRTPLHRCNLSGARGRKKKWSYWCVASDEAFFALTIADVDYLALAVATLLDLETKRIVEKAVPLRRLALGETVRGDDLVVERRGLFVAVRERGDRTILEARFQDHEARFEVTRTKTESLNVVVPWSDARFQLTSKQIALPVSGQVTRAGRTFRFESPRAWAALDFGRGVWPWRTRWQWSGGAGESTGKAIGWNLGGTWTRGTGATENAVWVDGIVHPISSEVSFARGADGVPRRIAGDGVDLAFEPDATRAIGVELGLLAARLRWGYGRFHGTIRGLRVDGLRGWAEDLRARW